MKFSYNWLQSYFDKKLPKLEKLAEILTVRSFETGVVEKIGDDYLLDIDVLPNRAHDCLSHIGIAREIAAITNYKLQIPNSKQIQNSKFKIQNFLKVTVEDSSLCPRYTAMMMTDMKVGPSPKWMQDRLKVCGLRPINNVVDATNYAMLETSQPLHAFDADKLSKDKGKLARITIRRAKKGEEITTIEGKKYDLDEEVLVIADNKKPIAIAGIKGGRGPEIDKGTKNIILEAANFDPVNIHHSSKKLSLRTDASIRFGYGIDPNLTQFALNSLAGLIQEISGGRLVEGVVDVYPQKKREKIVGLSMNKARSLLGVELSLKQVWDILERLGFKIQKFQSKNDEVFVVVPTWRLDVQAQEDLIEEVARIYGYEKILAAPPYGLLLPPCRSDLAVWASRARDILEGLGMVEVYNYSFVGERNLNDSFLNYIEIKNPVSEDLRYLRRSLVVNLLKNTKENLKHFNQIKIFEIGKVYGKDKKRIFRERTVLSGITAGLQSETKGNNYKDIEFFRVKGVVDLLLEKMGIPDHWYDDYIANMHEFTTNDTNKKDSVNIREISAKLVEISELWDPKRRAEVKIGQKKIGWLGEVDPDILNKMDIKQEAAAFEIDLDILSSLAGKEMEYSPIPKYPSMVRDIAILTDKATRISDVQSVIYSAGMKLIEDLDLFDIYEGRGIPEDKNSLAFRIIFRADDHTLTDKEVDIEFKKIVKALEDEIGAEIRK